VVGDAAARGRDGRGRAARRRLRPAAAPLAGGLAAEHAGGDARPERGPVEPDVKDDLRARTEAAFDLGVRGVPTLAVGDRLLYGDDRLEEASGLRRR